MKQIRMLRDHRAHQQATVASTLNRELSRTRVILVGQYSAAAAKSSNTFCFFVRLPALCHSSPKSPPPRMFATTYTPPRSNQSRRVKSKLGDMLIPSPPYAYSSVGLFPSRFIPFRERTFSGISVPSFEVANSRRTSISANETGDVLCSAVFTGSVFPLRQWNHAAWSV